MFVRSSLPLKVEYTPLPRSFVCAVINHLFFSPQTPPEPPITNSLSSCQQLHHHPIIPPPQLINRVCLPISPTTPTPPPCFANNIYEVCFTFQYLFNYKIILINYNKTRNIFIYIHIFLIDLV